MFKARKRSHGLAAQLEIFNRSHVSSAQSAEMVLVARRQGSHLASSLISSGLINQALCHTSPAIVGLRTDWMMKSVSRRIPVPMLSCIVIWLTGPLPYGLTFDYCLRLFTFYIPFMYEYECGISSEVVVIASRTYGLV